MPGVSPSVDLLLTYAMASESVMPKRGINPVLHEVSAVILLHLHDMCEYAATK